MPDDTLLLGQLADEFTARVRSGQMPDVAEYAAKHPGLAARIRELFPTLMLLEGMAGNAATGEVAERVAIAGGTVFGNYRIDRELGRGGMGVVYEALHQPLGKRVALKVLAIRTGPGAGQLERFLREAKTAASLHHTNIVPVFDVGQFAGTPYYAMQFIEGRGLDLVLRDLDTGKHTGQASSDPLGPTLTPAAGAAFDAAMSALNSPESGPAPQDAGQSARPPSTTGTSRGRAVPRGHVSWADYFRWTAELGIQAAEGIAHAHQRGVIHRDIKPSNLILDLQGVLWITDFGLARRMDDPDLTKSGSLLGTPRYMSPEQAAAAQRPIDHRTDIYSLGASLYEMLACRPAFEGATPMEVVIQILDREPVSPRRLNPAVPPDLETIVLKAMAKRPEDRYQSADGVADDLRRWLVFEPISARQISLFGRLARWCRRNPAVATLTTTVAALLVTIAIASTVAAVKMRDLAARERDAKVSVDRARLTAVEALGAKEAALQSEQRARDRAELAQKEAEQSQIGTEAARVEAERERNLAVASHEQAQDHLARSLYEQAHALRTSRQTGRRWLMLDRLRDAELLRGRERAAIGPDATGAPAAARDPSQLLPTRAALRSEALAALLLNDGRVRRPSETGMLGLQPPATSSDGRWLTTSWINTANRTSGARLIDLTGAQDERHIQLPDTAFASLALNADGTRLATATNSGVTLWALPSGEKLETLAWPADTDQQAAPARSFALPGEFVVCFSPAGTDIAASRSTLKPAAGNRQVIVWSLDGEREPQILAHGSLSGTITFSSDGKRLAFPASQSGLAIWDFETGKRSAEITPSREWSGQMAFCHKDQWLAIGTRPKGTEEGVVIVWDLQAARELSLLNATAFGIGSASIMTPNFDGSLLAIADYTGEIHIHRLPQGQELVRLIGGHLTPINLVRWTADGRTLISAGLDGSVRQWEVAAEVPLTTIDSGLANVARLEFSPDGRWLAVAPGMATRPKSADTQSQPTDPPPIRLIDRATCRVEREFATPGLPASLVFRSDSRQLAAHATWSAAAWELGTGEVVARFDGQRGANEETVVSCAFDEKGNLVLTRRANKLLTVIDPATRGVVWQPPENTDVQLGFLSPDAGRLVGLPTFDFKPQTWTVWNLPEGTPAARLPWSGATNMAAPVFSRANDWMAISYLDVDARAMGRPAAPGPSKPADFGLVLWNLPAERKQIDTHGAAAPTVYAISPDSHLLAIGYRDGTVHLWDVAAAEELFRWDFSSHPIAAVSFTSEGTALAVCDNQTGLVNVLDLVAVRREFTHLGLAW